MKLLALILAFAAYHYIEKPDFLKSFAWVGQWYEKIRDWHDNAWIRVVLALSLPVLLLMIAHEVFDIHPHHGVVYLITHVILIYYCLGPETIESWLNGNGKNTAENNGSENLVEVMTNMALKRWFGVFFWYVVLGILGVVLYRVIEQLGEVVEENAPESQALAHTLQVIEFPVTVLMTVALALASDFDRIWRHCKQFLNQETLMSLNSQFLHESMGFAVKHCETHATADGDEDQTEWTTYAVLKRMLVVWLVFISLLVLFSLG